MVNSASAIVSQIREPQPIVLIATDDPAASAVIAEQLERSGFDIRVATFDGRVLKDAPRRAPKAVLIYFKDYLYAAPHVLTTLRARYDNQDIAFIGAFPRKGVIDADLFDSVIFPPAHPVQIARRVTSMMRLQKMEREIMLRIETLKEDFGIAYQFSETALESPFRVLFIGKASPEFMVVINALENKNVEVIAAFTSFSAFDFLHENPFDAVVMNMLTGPEPALTICETMRRNSQLYHTPTLFLTPTGFEGHDEAYSKGATDIIPAGADEEEISGRILEVANYYRIHQRLKAEFGALGGERCIDDASGSYNPAFLRAHLRRVFEADRVSREPTSIMMLRFCPQNTAPENSERLIAAYNQAGRLVKNLVRMEDVVARISDDTFAVVFPGQSPETLGVVEDRIRGVLESAAFQTGERVSNAFQLSVNASIASAGPGESSDDLLSRVLGAIGPHG